MTRPGRSALPWLLLVVVATACGLVALGVWAMWRELRAAEALAQQEARRALATTARSLEAAAARPELLAAAPPSGRFALRDGQLEIPADLGWWREPPPTMPSFPVEALLARVERLEFGSNEGVPQAAAALLDEALAAPDVAEEDRAALLLARAFLAGRQGDTARLLAIAEEFLSAATPPSPANSSGCLLLAAHAGRPPPDWAAPSLRRTAPEAAMPLLARLRELRPQDAAIHAELARTVEDADAQRRTLRQVAPLVLDLATRSGAAVLPLGAGAVVYQATVAGSGKGAWFGATELAGALSSVTGVPPEDAARIAVSGAPPADAAAIWPGIWLRPAPAQGASPGRSWWLVALLAGLAACLAGSLWLALRALLRERAALAVRSEFLSSVSHELKTPLTSIRMFSEMLRDDRATTAEKRHEYARLLVGEAGRLQALVANVLDLGRLERGERSLDRREVELAEVVEEAQAVFEPVARSHGLRLEAAPMPRVHVRADRAALLQAVLNLLDNAAKYARAGGRVDLTLATGPSRVELRVRDHGPGIAPQDRERVFERFVRGREQANGAQPGLGLGLYMARSIARAHGGELRCEAPKGGGPGACFVLTLPRQEVAA